MEPERAPSGDGSNASRGVPVVAVVGRPNVGKSSLVNRIIGRREAIVDAAPGVTRDRRSFTAEWGGHTFEIVDTGGLEPGSRGLDAHVAEQAEVAIETADVIVLVVDGATGPMQDDMVVAEKLRRSGKPAMAVVNKVDDARDDTVAAAFYRLGLGEPAGVSALHGRGSGDLLDRLVAMLPEMHGAAGDTWGSLAIVGRPNVGKSSILNALLRENRSIVHDAPGTTRDPVDSYLALEDDRLIRIVDTAGMRRRVHIKESLEYFSWLRSREVLKRVEAALLVIDMSEGVTGLDQRLAQEIVDAGRACVIALNKWDTIVAEAADRERLERDLKEGLRWLDWAVVVRTSALTRRGIERLVPSLEAALESHRRRMPTPLVNRIVGEAQRQRPHPRTSGRSVRIRYAVQAQVAPPTIVLFTNAPLGASYLRYLENRVRAVEPFEGSPLKLQVRVTTRGERREREKAP